MIAFITIATPLLRDACAAVNVGFEVQWNVKHG